jgi:hypothetical protein
MASAVVNAPASASEVIEVLEDMHGFLPGWSKRPGASAASIKPRKTGILKYRSPMDSIARLYNPLIMTS